MTGPEHYAEAERLLAVADRHANDATDGQEWTPPLTATHVHTTLALAAATAVGTAGPVRHAWADPAVTKLSDSKPKFASDSSLGLDPRLGTLRMGHEMPGMHGVYGHVSPVMRATLKAALQARCADSLRERARRCPRSIVPTLDVLLTAYRQPQ